MNWYIVGNTGKETWIVVASPSGGICGEDWQLWSIQRWMVHCSNRTLTVCVCGGGGLRWPCGSDFEMGEKECSGLKDSFKSL